jgi:hypothetical protein
MQENMIIMFLIIVLIILIIGLFFYIRHGSTKIFGNNDIKKEVEELNMNVNKCVNKIKETQMQGVQQLKEIYNLNNQPIIKMANHYTDNSDEYVGGKEGGKYSLYYMSENTIGENNETCTDGDIPVYDTGTLISPNEFMSEEYYAKIMENAHIPYESIEPTSIKESCEQVAEPNNMEESYKPILYGTEQVIECDQIVNNDEVVEYDQIVNNNEVVECDQVIDDDKVAQELVINDIEANSNQNINYIVNPIQETPKQLFTIPTKSTVSNYSKNSISIKTDVYPSTNTNIDVKTILPMHKYSTTDIKQLAKQYNIPQSYVVNDVRKLYKKEELYKKIKSFVKKNNF